MNYYYLAFKYKDDVGVVKVSADQMANEMLGKTDDILDFMLDDSRPKTEKQFFSRKMFLFDNEYIVEFDDKDNNCLCVCECENSINDEDDERFYAGEIIQRGIPWVCIKIEDEDGEELYNLTNEI